MTQDAEQQLVQLLERYEAAKDLLQKGLLRESEASSLRNELRTALKSVLNDDSELSREYDKASKRTYWRRVTNDGYLHSMDGGELSMLAWYVEQTLERAGAATPPQQLVINASQFYTARSALRSILKTAKTTIDIFDEYLDSQEVLDIVEPYVEAGVTVRLLKASPSRAFQSDVAAMRQQYGNILELRDYVTGCHDRFIVVDGVTVYTVGGSLKDLGKKKTVITKILSSEAGKLKNDFNEWWSSARTIF